MPGGGGEADLGGEEHAVARRPGLARAVQPAAAAEIVVQVEVDRARFADPAVEDLELVEAGRGGGPGSEARGKDEQ